MSLHEFETIGKGVTLYRAKLGENNRSNGSFGKTADDSPALIIICTWLGGATYKRIQRYTCGYNDLWPKANILLIQTDPMEYAFYGESWLARKLLPASGEIRKLVEASASYHKPSQTSPSSPGPNGPEILLHVFSNGGANIATQLVASVNNILSLVGERSPLEIRQIVFDSCPGDPDTNAIYRAAAQSLPHSHPLRPLGCAMLYLVVAGIAGLEAVGIRKKLGRTMRAQFNNPAVFDKLASRLYLTSNGDVMMDTKDVQAHRDEALARGLRTDTVVFQRAGHCALVLEDEAAYWGAIAGCWERSGCQPAASSTDHDGPTGHDYSRRWASNDHASNQLVRSRL
ncbi:hypothetical protein N0V93_000597 [Gnomoniopsis smithogilvyi]|uniref:DUF829-domain-containing protein n=1 Tax=Gnomoniopsis smithogilvyi TaxID=1191159 RepID=A0A9W9D0V4_9PEZI|nr:hypothetical protein N0V93_000597 [Gnomoniopsis smithogilvyi]